MSFTEKALALALATVIAAPVPAWAFGGGAGYADLPDYARAQGALEGMTGACDMSVARARAITAAHDGAGVAAGRPSPGQVRQQRRRYRHHRSPRY